MKTATALKDMNGFSLAGYRRLAISNLKCKKKWEKDKITKERFSCLTHHVKAAAVHQGRELVQADLRGVQHSLDLLQIPLGPITHTLNWTHFKPFSPLHSTPVQFSPSGRNIT